MPVGSKLLTLLSSSFLLRRITVPRLACYSRYPIAIFSSAAVSHVRFVFTRTEPVFLSRVVGHFHTEAALKEECGESLTSSPVSSYSHPWPEWSKLADLLVNKDYSDRFIPAEEDDCTFLVDKDLPKKFLKDARACLGFAKERPDILSLLTKKNIEAVVLNGSPFLFKNSEDSAQRMKLFITREENNLQLEHEKAHTIDVMQYLLSYVYDSLSSSDATGLKSNQVVERFVRKLFLELFNLSGTVFKPKSVDSTLTKVPLSSEQFTPGQFTEMRSGNLIFSKFPDQTSVTLESQTSSSSNLTDVEYEKSMAFLKQGPEEESPQGRSCGEDYYSNSSGMNMNQANSTNKLNSPPHSHLGNNYRQTYPDEYIRKLTNHPPGSFQPNENTSYGGSTVNSSTLSDNPWTHQHVPPSCNSPSNNSSSLSYSAQIATSSLSARNLKGEEFRTSYRRFDNSTTTSSSPPWRSTNNTFYGGATMNSSHPPKDSWSDYNNSYFWKGAENSTQTSSNTWDNYNRPNGGFTPYSSQNSMRPSYNSLNNRNASSKENSSQPLTNWKNYTAAYDAVPTKSTQPSNNLWSNSNSNAFQPPNNSWTNYNANTPPNSWNKKNVGPVLESNRGFTRNTNHPSNNSWNNTRENWSGGFPRANSVTEGLPMQAQAQNTHDSGSYGCYSAKSLEGSSVKEPDPLDMSEEAKAERWFRRAAQIKDISELSQIPDEDFPQIMPMRKGVNRFVVSKRKTPLERRLVSQQHGRNFPVVSSEPEKAPAVGESDSQS